MGTKKVGYPSIRLSSLQKATKGNIMSLLKEIDNSSRNVRHPELLFNRTNGVKLSLLNPCPSGAIRRYNWSHFRAMTFLIIDA